MTKIEIVEFLALADVPEGACLVEREIGPGVSTFNLGGQDMRGIAILTARFLTRCLLHQTEQLSDTPSAMLLEHLHVVLLDYRDFQLKHVRNADVIREVTTAHKKYLERLREIARKLGIQYQEPLDVGAGAKS